MKFMQAFRLVEKEQFCSLLRFLRPNMKKRDIPSRHTIANEIYSKSLIVEGLLREKFLNFNGRISFTFDAGTTRAHDPFFTITCHWIDEAFEPHNHVITFTEIDGEHTGANIGSILIRELTKYGICRKDKVSSLYHHIVYSFSIFHPRLSLSHSGFGWLHCSSHWQSCSTSESRDERRVSNTAWVEWRCRG